MNSDINYESLFLRKKLNKKTTVSIGCGDKIFTILY